MFRINIDFFELLGWLIFLAIGVSAVVRELRIAKKEEDAYRREEEERIRKEGEAGEGR